VIFGKVLKGKSIVKMIENIQTSDDKPVKTVKISNCGELKEGEDDGIPKVDDGDIYEDWLDDYTGSKEPNDLLEIAKKIKEIGNTYYKKSENENANRKYSKAIRYLNEGTPIDDPELKKRILFIKNHMLFK
jgi:peptidyl-prolyl isomerase D